MILSFSALKNYFKVSNEWIVQPQTVQKKLHAPLTSPNLAKKKEKKKMIITLLNILLYICFITFPMCKKSKECQTQCLLISSKQS